MALGHNKTSDKKNEWWKFFPWCRLFGEKKRRPQGTDIRTFIKKLERTTEALYSSVTQPLNQSAV
jgi:hypothetical protein